MSKTSVRKELSLKGLELFQLTAQLGSLQAVAHETGFSISTISHHLKNIEENLGVDLFNHTRRPMVLTPTGHAFLKKINGALLTIRKAKAEASAGTLSAATLLRLGAIEDFDSDIVPELAVDLSKRMPKCDFSFQVDSSHTIIEMLRNRQLDLGITSCPSDKPTDLQETMLLKDPFCVLLRDGQEGALEDIFSGRATLPLIRFSPNQIISRQIESQLRRMGLSFSSRFECSNSQTQMAMVSSGACWAITTPLLFSRAKRFQPKLRLHPFPGKSFSRRLAIYSTPDCSESVLNLVNVKLRALIDQQVLKPLHETSPWLKDSFRLLD